MSFNAQQTGRQSEQAYDPKKDNRSKSIGINAGTLDSRDKDELAQGTGSTQTKYTRMVGIIRYWFDTVGWGIESGWWETHIGRKWGS